jgi:ADP-ribose pyrophosphatase
MAIRPWRTLSSEVALQAKLFTVRRDKAALPGDADQVVDYDYLDERSGAMVVALDDDRRTVLVEQYRYPIRATSLEFPSGCMNDGESPEEAARRELAEEIGYEASDVRLVGTFHPYVSASNTRTFVFLARGLRRCGLNRDGTEQMELCKLPFVEIEALIHAGTIQEAGTIVAYHLVKEALAESGKP